MATAALFLLLAGTLLLYAVGLGDSPAYLHDAEIQFALHAHSIAWTAHDTNGRLLPLYFQMPAIGQNAWFHPFLVYLTAPFLWLLPFSEATVRLPTAVLATVDVWLTYLVAARVFRRRSLALLAAALMALTPAHFVHGRVAMDYVHPVPFILGWLWCLSRFEESRSKWNLFAGTLILGIGVYTYIASIVMMPIYLAFTLIFIAVLTRSAAPGPYVACLAGFLLPLLPAFLWLSQHDAVVIETLGRYGVGSARLTLLQSVREFLNYDNVQEKISVYWDFFNPAYLFFAGGSNLINSTRKAGVFVLSLAILLPVGLYRAATADRSPFSILLIAGFLSAPFAATLVGERYAVDRALGILPFAALLAVYGIKSLLSPGTRPVWKLAAAAILLYIPLQFALFCQDYFTEYRIRSAGAFENNSRDACNALIAAQQAVQRPAVYLSRSLPYVQEYCRFYQVKAGVDSTPPQVTFDAGAFDATTIPAGSLVLAHTSDATVQANARTGLLKEVLRVPELGTSPIFVLYER